MPSRWTVRNRHFDRPEEGLFRCPKTPASVHPLKPNVVIEIGEKRQTVEQQKTDGGDNAVFVDPLGAALGNLDEYTNGPSVFSNGPSTAAVVDDSPILVRTTKGTRLENTLHSPGSGGSNADHFEPYEPSDTIPTWSERRAAVLSKVSTSHGYSGKNESDINAIEDKLNAAWSQDHRVESIKICIDAATLLSDSIPQVTYAERFFSVTSVLDRFGSLVLHRLIVKANSELQNKGRSPIDFDNLRSNAVPATIQETASNWFYKVASIRELLPRIYLESCLLRCARLVPSTSSGAQLDSATACRLVMQCRGIGDPLVAAYARCYVCRCALAAKMPDTQRFFEVYWRALNDTLQCWQTSNVSCQAEAAYPAVEFLVQCVGRSPMSSSVDNNSTLNGAAGDGLAPLWAHCERSRDARRLLLLPLLTALPAHVLARVALRLLNIVTADKMEASSVQSVPLTLLGRRCSESQPSPDVQRAILSASWMALSKYSNASDFVPPACAWATFACERFGAKEVGVLLEDIVRKVMTDQAFREFYPELLELLATIVRLQPDFYSLFALDYFVPFVDLFVDGDVRLKACRRLLESFVNCRLRLSEISGDASLCNHMLSLCKSLHDNLSATSTADERQSTAALLRQVLDKFTFESDPSRMLNVLVEARDAFCNLDQVIEYLVWRSTELTCSLAPTQAARPSRKRAQLARACVAYTYITVPVLPDMCTRLRLLLMAGQVALRAACLSQAEDQLKSAITLIGQFDLSAAASTHSHTGCAANVAEFLHIVRSAMSFLLVVPDPPETTKPLYLFGGLLAALEKVTWPASGDSYQMLMVDSICWLSAARQAVYPYHCASVEANDALYGGDQAFLDHIDATIERCLQPVLTRLKELNQSPDRRAALAGRLLHAAISWLDPSCTKACALIANLCRMTDQTSIGHAAKFTMRHLANGSDGKMWVEVLKMVS